MNHEQCTETPVEPSGPPHKRRRTASLAAAVAGATAVGLASMAALTATTTTAGADETKATANRDHHGIDSLDDVTLDELAEELADLGLELRIVPEVAGDTDGEWDDWTADGEWDELEDGEWDDWDDGEWDELDDSDRDEGDWSEGDTEDDAYDDEEPVARFDVDGDRLDTSDASADEAERANAIWQRFAELIPADQRDHGRSLRADGSQLRRRPRLSGRRRPDHVGTRRRRGYGRRGTRLRADPRIRPPADTERRGGPAGIGRRSMPQLPARGRLRTPPPASSTPSCSSSGHKRCEMNTPVSSKRNPTRSSTAS